MKRHVIICTLLTMLLAAVVVSAQPTTQPATKAPATKVAPATETPATPAAAPVETKAEPAAKAETKGEVKAEEKSEDTQAWWQGLLVTVIEGVVAIALPILSILGMALARKWKLKIEQDKLDWVLSKAIGFGEQKAKTALKDGKPMAGPEIAKIAVEQGSKLLEQYQLPKKLGDYLADLIEAKLGERVVEAGGARAVVNGTGGSEGSGS
jgi:hypothetical protein